MMVLDNDEFRRLCKLIGYYSTTVYLVPIDDRTLHASFADVTNVCYLNLRLEIKDGTTFALCFEYDRKIQKFLKSIGSDIEVHEKGAKYIFKSDNVRMEVHRILTEYAKYINKEPNIPFVESFKLPKGAIVQTMRLSETMDIMFYLHDGICEISSADAMSSDRDVIVTVDNIGFSGEYLFVLSKEMLSGFVWYLPDDVQVDITLRDGFPIRFNTHNGYIVIAPRVGYEKPEV